MNSQNNLQKKVSIVVFSYNQINYTINTLNSLLETTKTNSKYKYTFHLYDDCSSDNTMNYIKTNYKMINYYKEKQNKGYNYLCNRAYQNNKNSDYLVLLNNDLKFSKDWLNILLNQFNNNVKAGGPITNAPGHQSLQDIRNYIKSYNPSDKQTDINNIAKQLFFNKNVHAKFLNGFCLVFNTHWLNTLAEPVFEYTDPNFGLENIFFKKHKCNPIVVTSSFVFHYKQVTVNRKDWKKHHYRLSGSKYSQKYIKDSSIDSFYLKSFIDGNSKVFLLRTTKNYRKLFFVFLESLFKFIVILIIIPIIGIFIFVFKATHLKIMKRFNKSFGFIVGILGYKYKN